MQEYLKWKKVKDLDPLLKEELNNLDASGIKEAFSVELAFGTGGIRGIMGVGINRLNIYTLGKINFGYANFLNNNYKFPKVIIAYDTRYNSVEFALASARVLGTFGIKSYIFKVVTPTPVLSYAVRYLKADGGIIITASHNPSKYNGYKVYSNEGSQLGLDEANSVIEEADKLKDLFSLKLKSIEELKEEGFINYLDEEVYDSYLSKVESISVKPELKKDDFKLVYSPLHGTGGMLVERLLKKLRYNYTFVDEQMIADPEFSTVGQANPEDPKAFELAIKYAKRVDADLCLATDPDADRIGIVYKDKDDYTFVNGNQIGALIVYYLANNRKNIKNNVLINTIVTSDIGEVIAKSKNIRTVSVLTGFKHIAEQIKRLPKTNEKYFFGYEESYGYCVSDFVRDKDSIQALLILAELTNFYKQQGKNLGEVLEDIYNEFGYFVEETLNFTYEGLAGREMILKIMDYFRNTKFDNLNHFKIVNKYDFLGETKYNLPKENVLKFYTENNSWFALRPSGTEPKLKVYLSVRGSNKTELEKDKEALKEAIKNIIKEIERK